MATIKKTVVKAKKTAPSSKPTQQKAATKISPVAAKAVKEKNNDKLIADNFAAISKVVASLGTTLEMLVQKAESMAYHIIATEEILAELVAVNGLNLVNVNARIRAKIAAGTNNHGDANLAIDVAASIASPLPR